MQTTLQNGVGDHITALAGDVHTIVDGNARLCLARFPCCLSGIHTSGGGRAVFFDHQKKMGLDAENAFMADIMPGLCRKQAGELVERSRIQQVERSGGQGFSCPCKNASPPGLRQPVEERYAGMELDGVAPVRGRDENTLTRHPVQFHEQLELALEVAGVLDHLAAKYPIEFAVRERKMGIVELACPGFGKSGTAGRAGIGCRELEEGDAGTGLLVARTGKRTYAVRQKGAGQADVQHRSVGIVASEFGECVEQLAALRLQQPFKHASCRTGTVFRVDGVLQFVSPALANGMRAPRRDSLGGIAFAYYSP